MEIHSALIGLVQDDVSKGTSYLTGSDTTAFSNLGKEAINTKQKIIEGGTSVAGSAVFMVELTQLTAGELKAIAASMMGASMGAITSEAGKLIGEYTGKCGSLIASIPGKIAQASVDKFNEPGLKRNVNDVLAELMQEHESVDEAKGKKYDEDRKNSVISDSQKKVTEAINDVNKFIGDASNELTKIKDYALEGTTWVAEQMSKRIESTIDNIKKALDDHYSQIESKVNEFCKGEGDKIGIKLVEQYNIKIDETAHKIKHDKDNALSKTSIKAISAIQKGKLQIMSLTGINLPLFD